MDFLPKELNLVDPSHTCEKEVNRLLDHWYERQRKREVTLEFKAVSASDGRLREPSALAQKNKNKKKADKGQKVERQAKEVNKGKEKARELDGEGSDEDCNFSDLDNEDSDVPGQSQRAGTLKRTLDSDSEDSDRSITGDELCILLDMGLQPPRKKKVQWMESSKSNQSAETSGQDTSHQVRD